MQCSDGQKNRPYDGQSLTEYGLIGAAVLIASIAAVALLSSGLKDGFAHMIKSPTIKPVTVASLPSSAVLAKPFVPTVTGGGMLVSPDTLQIKLSDGSALNLNIPVDTARSIQTVGANGTTHLLASSLEELATQLKSQGKVDQAGSDSIMRLANLAHRIGGIESVVESAMAKSGGDRQVALNMPVVFDGKSYARVTDLTATIRTGNPRPDGSFDFGSQTKEFYDAYSSLWSAGVMNDPKVAGIMALYTHEIASLADGNRVVLDQMANNYGTPDAYRAQLASYMKSIDLGNVASQLSAQTGSAITHLDSATLCTTGGDTDGGAHCTR